MHVPLVSVVMPVYNGGRFLVDAVASIIEQSFSDWQLICINDGSSDQSGELLDWFAQRDTRIRVLHQTNLGIVAALNNGIAATTSPLICRMDCDDISQPDRLALQVEFLQNHPECVVVGGAILEIDVDSEPLQISRLPNSHRAIMDNLLHRKTGHFHPSTMIRSADLQAISGYRSQYQWIEDHDLWLRLADRGQLANLDKILLCYRQHASSVCWQRSELQRTLMNQLLTEAFQSRELDVPPHVLAKETIARSAAGPGKWARAAAKGGFRRNALKHLAELNRSKSPLGYKARMNLEVSARLLAASFRQPSAQSNQSCIPSFSEWHDRLAEEGTSSITVAAA